MFGTDTCPYCLKQKALFGASFSKINYKNCKTDPTVCAVMDFEWIPAWSFADWSVLEWLQSLETLAEKSGCELPDDNSE